jgi:YVTN family beta-propeller protein
MVANRPCLSNAARDGEMTTGLPSGTVTFLFTDIEGSTRLLRQLGREVYGQRLVAHRELLEQAVALNRGRVVDTQGDALFCVFRDASDALTAAVQAQRGLASDPDLPRVRMGLHTGGATVDDNRYLGVSVHRAQRICSAAHGGQILLSHATREVVEDDLPAGVDLHDLGAHELKDLDRPARLFEAVVEGLGSSFPPPRTRAADPVAGPGAPQRRHAVLIRLAMIGAAVAILAGVPVVYALATRGSGGPTLSKIDPNSVGIIDPQRNAVVDEVRVGNQPAHVTIGKGSVWIANEADLTAMKVDPRKGAIEHTYPTGLNAEALVVGQGAAWEGGQVGGRSSVARIDARYGTVTGPTPLLTVEQSPPVGNFGLAVMDRALWLTAGVTAVEANPRTLHVDTRRLDLAHHAIDMVAGAGSLWILNAPGLVGGESQGSVARFDPGSEVVSAPIPVGNDPATIAYGEGSVWVGLASGTVVRVDPNQNTVDRLVPSHAGLVDLAVGEGSVWVANRASPTVTRINPKSLKISATINVGTTPASIAVGFGKVWVTAY